MLNLPNSKTDRFDKEDFNKKISNLGFNTKTLSLISFEHIKEELNKFNPDEHIFIVHQTDHTQAEKILQSSYFSYSGLNGTALISNIDNIINTCYCMDSGQQINGFKSHRGSDSLVIMIVKKEEFKNCRNLSHLDDMLFDYIDLKKIDKWGLPNRCVWGYVNGISYYKNSNFTGTMLD